MSAGLTATGGLLGGVAQYESGQQKRTLFNADAGIAARQAQSEEAAGSYNETIVRQRGAQITGNQVANTGANNLQQTGTPAQVISSTAETNEMDALQTRNNAMRKAWGFQVQQESDLTQAKFAQSAGVFNAAGSILTGGSKAYTQEQGSGSWF